MTETVERRLEELQSRWLNEAMEGYSSDWGFMLNLIYRLQDELETYRVEQESLPGSLINKAKALEEAKQDLETEKKMHGVTLNLLEKSIEELASWREEAKKARVPS